MNKASVSKHNGGFARRFSTGIAVIIFWGLQPLLAVEIARAKTPKPGVIPSPGAKAPGKFPALGLVRKP